jgi:hypothetical protein
LTRKWPKSDINKDSFEIDNNNKKVQYLKYC